MLRHWQLLFLTVIAACDKTVPTPVHTKVLDMPSFTKLSVTSWTVGAPVGPATRVKKTYRYDPGGLGPAVRFQISFEHGPSQLVEVVPKGSPPPVQAPRAIQFEVIENPRWAMTASCDEDLKVPLAVNPDGTSAYPDVVWASCSLVMKRKNGDITVAPWIEIFGDGKLTVRGTGMDDRVVEEE